MNIPFELLMKDFSKTNYSSARAALLEAWRYFNARRQWMATYWARPIYELWLEESINRGIVDAPDFYERRAAWTRCKWIGPGRGWVDPVKEAKAAQLRMQIGRPRWRTNARRKGWIGKKSSNSLLVKKPRSWSWDFRSMM